MPSAQNRFTLLAVRLVSVLAGLPAKKVTENPRKRVESGTEPTEVAGGFFCSCFKF